MKNTGGSVTITILGKELMVACPDEERASLVAAARELDQRMREIQDGGKVLGNERVAVMAALNLSNELLQTRQKAGSMPDGLDGRLAALSGKIEAVLNE